MLENREAIANGQHLWSTPVSHLSQRSGGIKGGATEWMIERGTGFCLCFILYLCKPAVVREGLLSGSYVLFG